MAMKKTMQFSHPVIKQMPWGEEQIDTSTTTLLDAVIHVVGVTCSKAEGCAKVRFVSNDEKVLRSYMFDYDIAGENPIKQAYEHLKTLPEFAGAADI